MRLFKKSAIIFATGQLTHLTTLAAQVVLLRHFSDDKVTMGTYLQVLLAFELLVAIVNLQLGSSFYYYISTLGAERRRSFVVQTVLVTLVQASVIAGVLYFGAGALALSQKNPDLAPLLKQFSLYGFGSLVVNLVSPFLISLDRPLRAGAFGMLTHGGQALLAVGLFLTGASVGQVVGAQVVWMMGCGALGVVQMLWLSPGGRWRPERSLLVEQFSYCWPLVVSSMIAMLNMKYDRALISGYFGAASLAVYHPGARALPALGGLTRAVGSALMPDLARLGQAGEHARAFRLWRSAANKVALVIFPVFAFLLFNCREAVLLLLRHEYVQAAWPFAIYLLILPVQITVASALLKSFGQTRPVAVSAGLALVTNVVLSTSLVFLGRGTLFSFVAPAIGTVASGMVMMGYLFGRIGKTVGVGFGQVLCWGYLGRFLGVTLGCGAVTLLVRLPTFTAWPELQLGVVLAVRVAVFLGVWIAALWVFPVLAKEEMSYFLLPLTALRRLVRGAKGEPVWKRE